MEIKKGMTYEHYKGKRYTAIGMAKHSETLEELVIYQAQYGNNEIWARPKEMFFDKVNITGEDVDRFKLIDGE